MLVDEFVEKKKETMLERFGVDQSFKSPILKEKRKDTLLSRYGTEHCGQVHLSTEVIDKIKDSEWLANENKTKSLIVMSRELGLSVNAMSSIFRRMSIPYTPHYKLPSYLENEINDYVKSVYTGTIANNMKIIAPYEIDVMIGDHVAIECNGSYWHAELQGRDKMYHVNKTTMCKEKGIHLIHIWEHTWNTKQELIKSRIKSKLGVSDRVFARKCKVQEINSSTSKPFINANHIQGNCPASIRYGIFYEGDLIGVMTFGKSRYDKKIKYELLRYCTKQGINIVGGAGKLFKRFLRDYDDPSIISYSDRSWNTGSVYRAIGFEYSHSTPPSYHYTKDYVYFENRIAYQKHKLKDKLDVFDPSKTEWQNMQENGYDRIWDCGNDVYIRPGV